MKALVGTTVVAVRDMTPEEIRREGWDYAGTVIELSDGTTIFPSRDGECNGPGVLIGYKGREGFYVFPDKKCACCDRFIQDGGECHEYVSNDKVEYFCSLCEDYANFYPEE
jgi:hypothetical protein